MRRLFAAAAINAFLKFKFHINSARRHCCAAKREIALTGKETFEYGGPVEKPFVRKTLIELLKKNQARKFNLTRGNSAYYSEAEKDSLRVLPIYQPPDWRNGLVYPSLKKRSGHDPGDIGTDKRAGFNQNGTLLRYRIILDWQKQYRTVTIARRLALSAQLPHPAHPPRSGMQLTFGTQQTRIRYRICLRLAYWTQNRLSCAALDMRRIFGPPPNSLPPMW